MYRSDENIRITLSQRFIVTKPEKSKRQALSQLWVCLLQSVGHRHPSLGRGNVIQDLDIFLKESKPCQWSAGFESHYVVML